MCGSNVDPNAATKALAVGANIGSKQTFKISLSNCSLLTPLPTNPASGTAQTETRGAAIEFDQGSANINGATGNLMVTGFQPAKASRSASGTPAMARPTSLTSEAPCLRATYRRFS